MPLFFKIFLILFLKNGVTVVKKSNNHTTLCSIETELLARNKTIVIKGGRETVEELINLFAQEVMPSNIQEYYNGIDQPGIIEVKLSFIDLPYSIRNKIMGHLKLMREKQYFIGQNFEYFTINIF